MRKERKNFDDIFTWAIGQVIQSLAKLQNVRGEVGVGTDLDGGSKQ